MEVKDLPKAELLKRERSHKKNLVLAQVEIKSKIDQCEVERKKTKEVNRKLVISQDILNKTNKLLKARNNQIIKLQKENKALSFYSLISTQAHKTLDKATLSKLEKEYQKLAKNYKQKESKEQPKEGSHEQKK